MFMYSNDKKNLKTLILVNIVINVLKPIIHDDR
jgi:hypothetical protein